MRIRDLACALGLAVFFLGLAGFPFLFGGAFFLRHLGTWMVISDPIPQKLDYLFSFGGESAREKHAMQILGKHPETIWLSSHCRPSRKDYYHGMGADTARIELVDTCSNTRSEAVYLADWISAKAAGQSGHGPIDVGLVSGPYHMRRISFEIWRTARETNVRYHFLPVPFSTYGETHKDYLYWWRDEHLRHLILFEFKKILHSSFVYHHLLSEGRVHDGIL